MERIDNYKIVEKIGEGGMGEVYKGIDTMLEREVAIKMLRPELSRREDIVERFRSEAIALGRLNHSHIATVYNFGRIDDQYYMAMEFVPGETLDKVIQHHGRLPWRDAVHYAMQALEGLAHAHQSNVIHRDIKPANIVVTGQNNLKLLDFGIARILQTARLTRTKHTIGTPEYMSPEQHQGKEVDARSDIYAIGTVLYEMLTGQFPFQHGTEYGLIKAVIEDKPASLRSIDKTIPLPLEKLVLRALEKKPEKRFANAQEFILALRDCLAILDTKPKQTRELRPLASNRLISFCRDYPIVVAVGFLLTAGGGYAAWHWEYFLENPSLATTPTETASSALESILNKPITILPESIPPEQMAILQKAANAGDARAQAYLGRMYANGKGVKNDDAVAFIWFEKAALQGDATGQNGLGASYALGKGTQKNEATALMWYRKAADQGNARAQNNLGYVFENGLGVEKNIAEAITWYLKAADQGYASSQYHLGQIYANGDGVVRDDTKAFEWFQKAANLGDAAGQDSLGHSYQMGRGVAKNEAKAFDWYQKAADQGHAIAQYHLGFLYSKGLGVPVNEAKGFEWTQKAAEQGLVAAQFYLATKYHDGKGVPMDREKAFNWYQKAAKQDNAEAQAMLGYAYLYEQGVAKDLAKAVEWLQKAADQNLVFAQSSLGSLYLFGVDGIQADYAKSFKFNQKAAEQSDAAAQYNLGWMYRQGWGVPKSDKKAFQWFQKAADQNNLEAEYELAFMYVTGKGVKQDIKLAFALFQKQAESGMAKSQVMLGQMYLIGAGVPKDKAKSKEWFQKAAVQGSVAAQKALDGMQGTSTMPQSPSPSLNDEPKQSTQSHSSAQPPKKAKKAETRNALASDLAPPAEKYDRFIPRNR